ncbi:MAG: tRNA lysidine(34) synthetase TilS [Hyphomicrobiales bacterium]
MSAASRLKENDISLEEAARLLAPLARYRHLALAVSGGSDSVGVMLLAARCRNAGLLPVRLTVLTVDHGLRPASRAEAAQVESWAASLGFDAQILSWTGPKSATALQASAREARYDLMTQWCRSNGARAVVTAHTLDDQAETLLMRLARGSGLAGLSAMAFETTDPWPILRPFLAVSRARLRATLKAADHPWIDDPTNDDPRFERVRLRQATSALSVLGLTAEPLARSASRLARANRAIDHTVDRFLAESVRSDEFGVHAVALRDLAGAPEEIAIRALQRLCGHAGGLGGPLPLSDAENAHQWLLHGDGPALTVGGSRLQRRARTLLFMRESGRLAPARMDLAPGATVWDARYVIVSQRAEMLAILPIAAVPTAPARPPGVPASAWRSAPAVVEGERSIWTPGTTGGNAEAGITVRALTLQ